MVTARRRLFTVLPILVGAILTLLGAGLLAMLRSDPLLGSERLLREQADSMAAGIVERAEKNRMVRFEPSEALRASLEDMFVPGPTVESLQLLEMKVTVADPLGRIVFDREGGGYSSALLNNGGTAVLTVSVPLFLFDSHEGTLFVSRPAAGAAAGYALRERSVLYALAAAGAALVFLAFLTVVWATRPGTSLARYARRLGRGGDPVPPDLRGDEFEDVLRGYEDARRSVDGAQYVEKYVQTLTHEMKSPLSVLRGASELLEEEMSDEQRAVFVGNIRKETDRLQDLVDRLLQLSALEARRELRDVERVGLAKLAAEVVDDARELLSRREIAPDLDLDETAVARGERFLLRQALANILKNAVEFSPTGGAVGIRLAVEDGVAVFTVDDAGPGMPDYAVERAFEKFYSLGRPDTGRRSSGLGLPFVRETAQLHGGTVSIENMPGGGARVRFCLPVDPPSN